ncbi:hypothetical protein [Granulicella rosea]|uniref:hypothetical protein n=1 Tax=Granulicella rosea TaxID=474952 RepID=UPI00115DC0A9|nr:hypothetical protein [Granulicella rosea]
MATSCSKNFQPATKQSQPLGNLRSSAFWVAVFAKIAIAGVLMLWNLSATAQSNPNLENGIKAYAGYDGSNLDAVSLQSVFRARRPMRGELPQHIFMMRSTVSISRPIPTEHPRPLLATTDTAQMVRSCQQITMRQPM